MTGSPPSPADGSPRVSVTRENGTAWITLSNPSRMNALTAAMWAALPEAVREVDADPAVRVIVLRGEGTTAFSAGADISEFASARTGEAAATYDQLNENAFQALIKAEKPVVAMIHGFCLGGGLGIAALADIRLADDQSQFAIPPAKLGIGYNPRWIPPLLALAKPAHVKEMLFTGRRFKSADALAMGLVNRVLPADDLLAATKALAAEIGQNAPLSICAAKFAIDELTRRPEHPDLGRLDDAVQACFKSQDYVEGRQAFLEKRKPQFKGQ